MRSFSKPAEQLAGPAFQRRVQRQLEELKSLRQLAFVITDLEASTAIAAAAPRHFEKVRR